MAITKYETYYNKIRNEIEPIKDDYEYNNYSLAFAHWYLKKYYNMDEQSIAEAIIDGADDRGLDAVIIDEENETLTVMQFKFPAKVSNINDEIELRDVLVTWDGFETLISNAIEYKGTNEGFAEKKDQLKNLVITKFRIAFVSFNKGVFANRETIESKAELFRNDSGSEIDIIYHDKKSIGDIYERLNRKNNLKIDLKYKQMTPAYNVQERNINSYVGFVNGKDLIDSISSNIATIFDENIRLYEYGSNVNLRINKTATSSEEADMFYFYSNGVVFICDEVTNSPASNTLTLKGSSVVNGCQTLNVLYTASQKSKLKDDVNVLVRVIEIKDYSERMKITEYLNSQTTIKDSYFVSNHAIVRDLQSELLEKGYYLERQVNEYKYHCEHDDNFKKVNNVLQLELILQCYTGYHINKYASTAKREKNALFDKNRIEEILSSINAEKVLVAYHTYNEILDVITMYRKYRRNQLKFDFADYLGVSHEEFASSVDEFKFLNTADILLLNAVANLTKKYNTLDIVTDKKRIIIDSIYIIKTIICDEPEDNTSLLTKNSNVFAKVQNEIESMQEEYKSILS